MIKTSKLRIEKVVLPDALSDPWAMMVHFKHAAIANRTVVGPLRLFTFTLRTKSSKENPKNEQGHAGHS